MRDVLGMGAAKAVNRWRQQALAVSRREEGGGGGVSLLWPLAPPTEQTKQQRPRVIIRRGSALNPKP
jgi:hypothetical protein